MKRAPQDTLTRGGVASATPPRVARTLYAGNTTGRGAMPGTGSSITYNPQEHRFVNANSPRNGGRGAIASDEVKAPKAVQGKVSPRNAQVMLMQRPNSPSAPAVPRASLPPRAGHDAAASALCRGWLRAAEFRFFWWRGLGRRPRFGRFFSAPRLRLRRIHREAAGARIRTDRFGDPVTVGRASPRPVSSTFLFSGARRVFCMRVRQTSYPRSRPRRRDRPRHLRKWHSARVPLFLRPGVASP